jgi:predicted glycosyltransferase
VFIGSGGTMTAESALLGVPTISFDAVPNLIQTYLIKKKLILRETDPKKVILAIKRLTRTPKMGNKRKAKKVLSSFEDPYPKLVRAIKSII